MMELGAAAAGVESNTASSDSLWPDSREELEDEEAEADAGASLRRESSVASVGIKLALMSRAREGPKAKRAARASAAAKAASSTWVACSLASAAMFWMLRLSIWLRAIAASGLAAASLV